MKELRPDRIVVALAERRRRLPVWGFYPLASRRGGGGRSGVYETIMRKLAIESLTPASFVFQRLR